jgi:prolyl 4-hydroxylase
MGAVQANEVSTRLRALPGVQRHPSSSLDLFIIRNFAEPQLCAQLIERIDANRRPSTIVDDLGIADFRTSETCDLSGVDPVVHSIEQRIAELLGLPLALAEPLQGQRYAVGQEFKVHTDTFEPGRPEYYQHVGHSGQRTWTAMLYLNEPEAGGATRFKAIGKVIQPEAGKLLVWNNLLTDGRPNPATLHQGMKVRQGLKYILTLWFREGPHRGDCG